MGEWQIVQVDSMASELGSREKMERLLTGSVEAVELSEFVMIARGGRAGSPVLKRQVARMQESESIETSERCIH